MSDKKDSSSCTLPFIAGLLVGALFVLAIWSMSATAPKPLGVSAKKIRALEKKCVSNAEKAYRIGYDRGHGDAIFTFYRPDLRAESFRFRVLVDSTEWGKGGAGHNLP